MAYVFKLLHRSADPKAINIMSGLGSISSVLSKSTLFPAPANSAGKVGLNGLAGYMQAGENNHKES